MGVTGVWKMLPSLDLCLFSGVAFVQNRWRYSPFAQTKEALREPLASIPAIRRIGKAVDPK